MDIRVSGHQVETGAAFEAHAADRLSGIVDKYFSRALSSQVTLGKAPHGGFRCDIVTHVTQGLILKGSGVAQDVPWAGAVQLGVAAVLLAGIWFWTLRKHRTMDKD